MLHKEVWVAKLLGTHLSIQVHKKVKFSWRDNSPLALKGLSYSIISLLQRYQDEIQSLNSTLDLSATIPETPRVGEQADLNNNQSGSLVYLLLKIRI